MSKSAIVIGAGIVGLATARALALRNYDVTVFERNPQALGASIRNFGMIWPIGQPDGELYETALSSRSTWMSVSNEIGNWYDPVGSIHLAYTKEEWLVLQEVAEKMRHRDIQLLSVEDVAGKSKATVTAGLMGGLYSPTEIIVDPRRSLPALAAWLNERYGVQFHWGKAVTDLAYPIVYAGPEDFTADEVYVCNGADFETLYPSVFSSLAITKCKLQMMRMHVQPDQWRLGPALCGGLSLVHYKSFQVADSLELLKKQFEEEYPEYLQWGIHVMVAQNGEGSLTIGDSHEFGLAPDPFDRQFINQLILDYLKKFARFPDERISETWNGVYPKLTNGDTHLILHPEPGVTIINCLGGAGMTLSFGLCEKLIGSPSNKSQNSLRLA